MRIFLTTWVALALLILSGCGDESATSGGQPPNGGEQSSQVIAPSKEGVIGKWRDNVTNPIFHSNVTILAKDGKLYYVNEYDDGSEKRMEVVENKSDLGRRFDPVIPSRLEDHWVIDENGDLLMRDKHGTAAVAKKIE
ncbi:uncharacterized protein FOKN1_0104 [Thiohalobacter thiocyanaticus]|uniref:Uncharacterized protein n=1 Tax=Thiohalobacter thiocyanaticus TaxID=585455 RepID=A0A1Z4VLN0_9GAMM|nr:hypothetical protein [Thiohalobacter thiocyanaticus]BAZ92509.1 uncharacterized protein FOKN1_0104 [Thiohalobacter thiocyanaticus]